MTALTSKAIQCVIRTATGLGLLLSLFNSPFVQAQVISETPEIVFSSAETTVRIPTNAVIPIAIIITVNEVRKA